MHYIFATNKVDVIKPDYAKMVDWAKRHVNSDSVTELSDKEVMDLASNHFLDQVMDICDCLLGNGEEHWETDNKKIEEILITMEDSLAKSLYEKDNVDLINRIKTIVSKAATERMNLFLIFSPF